MLLQTTPFHVLKMHYSYLLGFDECDIDHEACFRSSENNDNDQS